MTKLNNKAVLIEAWILAKEIAADSLSDGTARDYLGYAIKWISANQVAPETTGTKIVRLVGESLWTSGRIVKGLAMLAGDSIQVMLTVLVLLVFRFVGYGLVGASFFGLLAALSTTLEASWLSFFVTLVSSGLFLVAANWGQIREDLVESYGLLDTSVEYWLVTFNLAEGE